MLPNSTYRCILDPHPTRFYRPCGCLIDGAHRSCQVAMRLLPGRAFWINPQWLLLRFHYSRLRTDCNIRWTQLARMCLPPFLTRLNPLGLHNFVSSGISLDRLIDCLLLSLLVDCIRASSSHYKQMLFIVPCAPQKQWILAYCVPHGIPAEY